MRRKLILFLLCLFTTSCIYAQEKKIKEGMVPDTVLGTFRAKYKKAEPQWYETEDGYLAAYRKGDNKMKSSFTADGKWTKTSQLADKKKMNGKIKKYLEGEYKKWKVSQYEKVETPEVKRLLVVTVKKDKEVEVLTFDEKGNPYEKKE